MFLPMHCAGCAFSEKLLNWQNDIRFQIRGMQRFAYIPDSPAAARTKLRKGLGDWWRFIVSAPCHVICWVGARLFFAKARLHAERKRFALSVAIWARDNLAWTALIALCKLVASFLGVSLPF